MDDRLANALKLLPHGPEFRFVDRLITLIPGKEGVGEYAVRPEESFLRGHFPGSPIFPGVLMVEALAQLAGVVAQSDPAIPPLPALKLTALKNIKILGTASPSEVIRITARISGRLSNLIQAEGTATANGRLLLQGSLTLSGSSTKA